MPKGIVLPYETVEAEANKYSRRIDFKRGSPAAYGKAHRKGWLDELGLPPSKWTFAAVEEVAKKYSTRSEFKKGCYNAYKAACRKGWLNVFFPQEECTRMYL